MKNESPDRERIGDGLVEVEALLYGRQWPGDDAIAWFDDIRFTNITNVPPELGSLPDLRLVVNGVGAWSEVDALDLDSFVRDPDTPASLIDWSSDSPALSTNISSDRVLRIAAPAEVIHDATVDLVAEDTEWGGETREFTVQVAANPFLSLARQVPSILILAPGTSVFFEWPGNVSIETDPALQATDIAWSAEFDADTQGLSVFSFVGGFSVSANAELAGTPALLRIRGGVE